MGRRVLFISYTAGWTGPTHSLLLILRYVRKWFDVAVLLPGHGDFSQALEDEGIPFFSLPRLNKWAIPAMIRLADKTMSVVHQNFAIAIGVNTVGLMLGSLGVLPVFWGAVLHNATTVAVVLNSGRLLFHDVEKRK